MVEEIAAAYYSTGKEFSIVTSHPAMIATLAKSENWKCNRSYSVSPFGDSILYSDVRATCGFIFKGEPKEDNAKRLGITQTKY